MMAPSGDERVTREESDTDTEWPARDRRFEIDETRMEDGRYRLYYSWPDDAAASTTGADTAGTAAAPATTPTEEPNLAGPGRGEAPDAAEGGSGV